jgi:hypothetical protein
MYLLRKDALFAYVVVLKDPASGNTVPTNGVPTVILSLVHSEPVPSVYLDDLERDFPPEVVDTFIKLNVQMNPLLLKHTADAPNSGLPVGGLRRPRLKEFATDYCTPDSTTVVSWGTVSYTSSDVSMATTETTTTSVTGYVASIFGDEGTVTQSITLSSNQDNWAAYEQDSLLNLKCPEIYPPYQSWEMEFYLDTLFGTLLAVTGEKSTTTNPVQVAGVVLDASGDPIPGEVVTLKIGGRTLGVLTGQDGAFGFRVPALPTGAGTLLVAKQAFRVTYRGAPLSDLRLTLSRRGTTAPGRPPR